MFHVHRHSPSAWRFILLVVFSRFMETVLRLVLIGLNIHVHELAIEAMFRYQGATGAVHTKDHNCQARKQGNGCVE